MTTLPPFLHLGQRTQVIYTNYRGETAIRQITPQRLYIGQTEYHPQEQPLLEVWDHERNAARIYALKEIKEVPSEKID